LIATVVVRFAIADIVDANATFARVFESNPQAGRPAVNAGSSACSISLEEK
jgi:hypothetical protein